MVLAKDQMKAQKTDLPKFIAHKKPEFVEEARVSWENDNADES